MLPRVPAAVPITSVATAVLLLTRVVARVEALTGCQGFVWAQAGLPLGARTR
jgi:hypothetical protein